MILSEKQKAMIVSALCGAIIDLKRAKIDARRHKMPTAGYDREIEAFVELKRYIVNDRSDENTDK